MSVLRPVFNFDIFFFGSDATNQPIGHKLRQLLPSKRCPLAVPLQRCCYQILSSTCSIIVPRNHCLSLMATPTVPEMFLVSGQWSPRFENTFFTVKLDGFELLESEPEETGPTILSKGKGTFPAYYYKITVFCGHAKHTVRRRYSQFDWLVSSVPPDRRVRHSPAL